MTVPLTKDLSMSASAARARLFSLIEEVNNDHTVKHVTSNKGNVVIMAEDDYNGWQETIYLLRSPANAARLMAAVERDKAGGSRVHKTMEELEALTGDGEA